MKNNAVVVAHDDDDDDDDENDEKMLTTNEKKKKKKKKNRNVDDESWWNHVDNDVAYDQAMASEVVAREWEEMGWLAARCGLEAGLAQLVDGEWNKEGRE